MLNRRRLTVSILMHEAPPRYVFNNLDFTFYISHISFYSCSYKNKYLYTHLRLPIQRVYSVSLALSMMLIRTIDTVSGYYQAMFMRSNRVKATKVRLFPASIQLGRSSSRCSQAWTIPLSSRAKALRGSTS